MQFCTRPARRMAQRTTLALTVSLALSVLGSQASAETADLVAYRPAAMPAMRWDARPEAATWTSRTLAVVAAHDSELAARVPADIATFCPHYPKASLADRRAFWVGLLSATAKHESGFNPRASGGGGRYVGLMQISPRTAQHYQCRASKSSDLKDGTSNLACAVEIVAPHVAQDGLVAGKGNRGIGRDWGPFQSKAARADIAGWTARQSYCHG